MLSLQVLKLFPSPQFPLLVPDTPDGFQGLCQAGEMGQQEPQEVQKGQVQTPSPGEEQAQTPVQGCW